VADALSRRLDGLHPRVVVAVVLALHLLLVVLALNPAPHTGGDNAGYVALGRSLLEHGRYLSVWQPGSPPHTQYPPVFPALLAAGMVLGLHSWLALKLVTVLCSGVAVAFTFLWLDRRTGRATALGVTLLLAVAPGVLENAHWILSDVPFWAFTMMALWAFQDADDDRRFAVAAAATVLAYFTRSAGLPLVLAALAWLMLRRRWRRAAVLAAVFVPLAGVWWLRAHHAGGMPYLQQFLAVDPYTPALGRIGPGDLLRRVRVNGATYAGTLLPKMLIDAAGLVPAIVAVLLVALGTVGWAMRLRRPGLAELFLPLYVGVLLVWPQVWAGERFLLPVLPILLALAAEAVLALGRRAGRRAAATTAFVALACLLVAAAPADVMLARRGGSCMTRYRRGQPYACVPSAFRDFLHVAEWARSHLPPDAVVISRKPRIFYVMSDRRSEMFPLDREPGTLLALAERTGARYVVLDHLDEVSLFLLETLARRPGAFCTLFYTAPDRATMLGIRPGTGASPGGAETRGGQVVLKFTRCGSGYLAR